MARQRSTARHSPQTAGTTHQIAGTIQLQAVQTSWAFGSTMRRTQGAPLTSTKALKNLSLRLGECALMTSTSLIGLPADQPSWTAMLIPPVSISTVPSFKASSLLLRGNLRNYPEPSNPYAWISSLQRICKALLLICLINRFKIKILKN